MTSSLAIRRSIPADATITMRPARDGWPIRVFDRAAEGEPRGSILWLGGRGDIFEKYLECFERWHDERWHVTSFDWRGQGGSGRLLADSGVGHAPEFDTWLYDLTGFWREWVAVTPPPHVVMGHSMGGHLVLRALIEGRIAPEASVLIAPMLGFDAAGPIAAVAPWLAGMLGRIVPERRAWRDGEKPGAKPAQRASMLTHDTERYDDEIWWKTQDRSLALGPASWGWIAASYRSFARIDRAGAVEQVATPTLVIGTDGDALVSHVAMRRVAARLPHGELLMFDKSVAHEVLREIDSVRDVALDRIDAFFDKHAQR